MKVGNLTYKTSAELPAKVPVFPISGALLLPGGQLPLNIFEPEYLEMFDDAISQNRMIAMIQPLENAASDTDLYKVGCLGRITAFQESGDGRYLVNLSGICRYETVAPVLSDKSYQTFEVQYFENDLIKTHDEIPVDRKRLLTTLRNYLEANQMDADWDSVEETETDQLVNALCMMSPYGPAEKQAMLEANDIVLRAETLIAITEFELTKTSEQTNGSLQ